MLVKLTRIGQLTGGGHRIAYQDPKPELVNLRFVHRVEYWDAQGLAVWQGPNFCPIYRETMEELEKLMKGENHEIARSDTQDAGPTVDK